VYHIILYINFLACPKEKP